MVAGTQGLAPHYDDVEVGHGHILKHMSIAFDANPMTIVFWNKWASAVNLCRSGCVRRRAASGGGCTQHRRALSWPASPAATLTRVTLGIQLWISLWRSGPRPHALIALYVQSANRLLQALRHSYAVCYALRALEGFHWSHCAIN